MDILSKCRKWHEEDEHQKIIDLLEALPFEERTMEIDMELARAYNNLGNSDNVEGRRMLKTALELMQQYEDELGETYSWNFRMGYALCYLEQEGKALQHFEKALYLHPGDDPKLNTREEIEEFIAYCRQKITIPCFDKSFKERVEECWNTFAEMEEELRRTMYNDKGQISGTDIVSKVEETLHLVFYDVSFEMGFNGEKHELILTPEGDKVKLFELVYFRNHAPKEVLKHWNILVGRQPLQKIGLRTDDGWEVSGDDVRIWVEEQGEYSFSISAWCEKLLPMLKEEEGRAWWMLTTLTDQVLGEISHMRYIDGFDVLEKPKEEPSIFLSQLPQRLKNCGIELSTDPEECLESYLCYTANPEDDTYEDRRMDIMSGSTTCVPLLNGYIGSDNYFMDNLHADGVVAGFLFYPLDTLFEEEGSDKIFEFRDKLEKVLISGDGPEVLRIIGGATGIYCGYVDFIAWDIQAALDKIKDFFESTDIAWVRFSTFRRKAGTVILKNTPEED